MYLNSEIVESIQDQLEENSEIQLDEFLLVGEIYFCLKFTLVLRNAPLQRI